MIKLKLNYSLNIFCCVDRKGDEIRQQKLLLFLSAVAVVVFFCQKITEQ